MTAPPATSLRLVVPSPGSWLTSCEPEGDFDRYAIYDDWLEQARYILFEAQASDWHKVIPTAVASVEVRLASRAKPGLPGIHAPSDVNPSWYAVREAIEEVGVRVAREGMPRFGQLDQHGGQLVVELRPLVVRGG